LGLTPFGYWETLKLRNEPNFSAKKPMKVHKCPKKRTQFKATGEAGQAQKAEVRIMNEEVKS
jgi:hypothetical protein